MEKNLLKLVVFVSLVILFNNCGQGFKSIEFKNIGSETNSSSPTPTPTATPIPSPAPIATPTPRPSATAIPTPSPSPTATPTPRPSATAIPTPTSTPQPTPTATPAPTPTPIASPPPGNQEQDWTARTSSSSVFYSNNFTYKNAAKTALITNDSDLAASAAQLGGNTSLVKFDQTHNLSGGGCARMQMPAANRGVHGGYAISFAGIGLSAKTTVKHQFYVQFAVYADSVYRNFFYGGSSVWGGKLAIIEAPNTSFDTGEVVIRRTTTPGGFLTAYRIPITSGVSTSFGLAWPAFFDYTDNNFIDRGSPVVTDQNTLQRRHGINYLGQSSTGNDPDYQHSPRLAENGWTVIEAYVDQVNDIVKLWMAPYGSAPTLTLGAMRAGLPDPGYLDGANLNRAPLYTGVQFTNYHNSVTNWPTTDTFICYDEIIASDAPINFPGGKALPNPGTQTPPNYPPPGAHEL